MPRYTFELQDGTCPVADGSGVWLANRQRAFDHAQAVARELMRGGEPKTRSWRLDVYEDDGLIFEIPFATIDPTLDHLSQPMRRAVEASWESIHVAQQTISAARATMREAKALVARARGKPYLAAERGEPTIRTAGDRRGGGTRES